MVCKENEDLDRKPSWRWREQVVISSTPEAKNLLATIDLYYELDRKVYLWV